MRRAFAALGIVLALGFAAGRADAGPAHHESRIPVDPKREYGGPAVAVSADLVLPASGTSSGWGSIRVFTHNETDLPRDVSFEVADSSGTQRSSVRLAPGEWAVSFFAARDRENYTNVRCDCPSLGRTDLSLYYSENRGEILAVDASTKGVLRTKWTEEFDALAKTTSAGAGFSHPVVFPVAIDTLPERWTLLSAADVILVDADPAVLTPDRQRALARYVAAGGTLVLSDAQMLGAGPLADLQAASFGGREFSAGAAVGGTTGRYGFGRWIATRWTAAGNMTVRELLDDVRDRRGADVAMEYGILPRSMSRRLEIPGLGEVSVRAFFAWIALFALLIGIAVFVLQRRFGRRTALVVVVPALGLLFTAGILAYGLLSEGLGTRGAVRTFTFLDQRSHDAISTASRTLYAGLSPDSLRLSPDTLMSSPNVPAGGSRYRRFFSGRSASRPVDVDWSAGGGVVDGAMIASRTPTGIATATAVRARERLRFKKSGDLYDVVADSTFAPVAGSGLVLFRHPDGRYYRRHADGLLAMINEADVPGAIATILGRYRTVELESRANRGYDDDDWDGGGYGYSSRRYSTPTPSRSGEPPTDRLGAAIGTTLPPGSYLALTTSAPGFDTLGLSVTYEAETHIVFGLLAAEDVDD